MMSQYIWIDERLISIRYTVAFVEGVVCGKCCVEQPVKTPVPDISNVADKNFSGLRWLGFPKRIAISTLKKELAVDAARTVHHT